MIHDCLSKMLEVKKRASEVPNESLYANQAYGKSLGGLYIDA